MFELLAGGLALIVIAVIVGSNSDDSSGGNDVLEDVSRRWPVDPKRGILSPFGASRDSGKRIHAGVDLGALPGDAIVSIDHGTVLYPVTGFSIGAGLQAIAVKHPDADYIYAEISDIRVKPGDTVEPGTRIGTAAKNADGNSMLHLEAWESAPHAFTPWAPGSKPKGLLDVQSKLA